jgi:hypothetical protein
MKKIFGIVEPSDIDAMFHGLSVTTKHQLWQCRVEVKLDYPAKKKHNSFERQSSTYSSADLRYWHIADAVSRRLIVSLEGDALSLCS